jgi:hypothetical protein
VVTPIFTREEGLKDAASLSQWHNWKLTTHNRTVWRQKAWGGLDLTTGCSARGWMDHCTKKIQISQQMEIPLDMACFILKHL